MKPIRTTLLAALTAASMATTAGAQTLTVGPSLAFRGGVTTDGWSAVSSPTEAVTGEFRIRVPAGGRVRQALLYSSIICPGCSTAIPAGPTGTPRRVTLGTGTSATTRILEGAPTYNAVNTWASFRTDVTAAVQGVVGPSAAGGEVSVPVTEIGDQHWNHTAYPQILGHTLVVLYDLDYGPVRSVVVYEGIATNGFTSPRLPLPAPAANRCPTSATRAEPFAASINVNWEYSGCEEESTVVVNGSNLTTTAGGSDDFDQAANAALPRPTTFPAGAIPAAQFGSACSLATAALGTTGSFGGAEAGSGLPAGAPVGLQGDAITGAHTPSTRLDDELYDFRTRIADGDTTIQFGVIGDGDESLNVIVLQLPGRVAGLDADGDTIVDTTEGDCTTDTDSDGTPDYLDTDSDNDCVPDRDEPGAGRTDPNLPAGSPDGNCAMRDRTRPVCDRVAGVCLCRSASDCGGATPVCDPGTRSCRACALATQSADCPTAPATRCVTAGPNAGRCAACLDNTQCSGATPVCDAATNACAACTATASACTAPLVCASSGGNSGRCVPCTTNAQCSGATPVCDTASNTCVACNREGAPACPSSTVCVTAGANAGRCLGCNTAMDCAGATPVCDTATNTCVPCARDAQCPAATPACVTSGEGAGRCVGCLTASHCTSPMVCDTAMRVCVGCNTNSDCAGETPFCDGATRMCRACTESDCTGDTPACAAAGASRGRCVQCTAERSTACTGATPVCDGARNVCVGCNTASDCADPSRPVCEGNVCRACATATESTDCPTMGLPRCAVSGPRAGRCVQCTADSQCGAEMRCEGETGACVPAPRPDASVPDVTVVDASAPDASVVDAPADLGMDATAPITVGYQGGGCGCRVTDAPATRTPTSLLPFALAALAAVGLRRRRR